MAYSLRRPTLDESNRLFTAMVIGWGAALGSVISFMLSGSVLWAALYLLLRRIALPENRAVLWIGAAFALFFAAEALAGLVNWSGGTLIEVVENLPFLGFLLVYGRLSLSRREEVLRACEVGTISGAFAACLIALMDVFLLGDGRAEGLAGNPGVFALLTSVLYGLTIVIATRRNDSMRPWAVVAAVAAGSALILSGSRSLWPMLLVGLVIPLLVYRARFRLPNAGVLPVALAGLIALMAFVAQDVVQSRVMAISDSIERVEEGDYGNSLGQRIRVWRAGAKLAVERPLLGHGPGRADNLVANRTAADGGPRLDFSHVHNFILEMMVRSGVVGVLALLIMLGLPIFLAAREAKDDIATAGFAFMLIFTSAYFFSGLFGIMLGHDITDAFFIYGSIVSSYLVFGHRAPPAAERDGKSPEDLPSERLKPTGLP